MPVYNAEKYLSQAIESILDQTYKEFEFIVVDDNSTDGSWSIIQRFAKEHKKIRAYKNRKHLGICKTVNKAIQHAKGQFIARMDADDISLPRRLEKQVAYLTKQKNTVAVGTQCYIINAEGDVTGEKHFPTSHEEIQKYIFKFAPVQQPSLMINTKRLPKSAYLYNTTLETAEELDLLFKLFSYGKVENMTEKLLAYRIHNSNTSFKNIKKTFLSTILVRLSSLVHNTDKVKKVDTLLMLGISVIQMLFIVMLPQKAIITVYKLLRLHHTKYPLLVSPILQIVQ